MLGTCVGDASPGPAVFGIQRRCGSSAGAGVGLGNGLFVLDMPSLELPDFV